MRRVLNELAGEVMNGGFNQYFFNSAGDDAATAIEALDAIGARETHALLVAACSRFPGGMPPSEWSKRQEALEEVDPNTAIFEQLDQAFFAYPDNLDVLLDAYERRREELLALTYPARDAESFAADYFRVWRALRDDAPREERLWLAGTRTDASIELDGLLSEDPEEAWRLILALVERAPDAALGFVAAGPIEDLIFGRGAEFADRIEAEARQNPRFRVALDMTWGWDQLSDAVRDRLLPLLSPDVRAYWAGRVVARHPSGSQKPRRN